jgi:hypothetical protein
MLDGLKKLVGSVIIVDYKTNSGRVVYAKGILKEIIDEENTQMLVIEAKDGTLWYIGKSSIESLKIGGEEL